MCATENFACIRQKKNMALGVYLRKWMQRNNKQSLKHWDEKGMND